LPSRAANEVAQLGERLRPHDLVHAGAVELGVDVVDVELGAARERRGAAVRGEGQNAGALEEFPPLHDAAPFMRGRRRPVPGGGGSGRAGSGTSPAPSGTRSEWSLRASGPRDEAPSRSRSE